MMWVFGQVWLLCLLSFLIGAALDMALFTRPLRKQVRQLEIELSKARRSDAAPPPPEPPGSDLEQTGIVDDHPVPAGQSWDPDRLPSWEREQQVPEPEPYGQQQTLVQHQPDLGYAQPEYHAEPTAYGAQPDYQAEHEYRAEHEYQDERHAEPEPEPVPAPEPPKPAQVQPEPEPEPAAKDAPPPIPNPSPAEMTAVISRLSGTEPSAAETTSILPPARDLDPAEMELADHGTAASPQQGQLAHAPTDDWENEEYLVDDVAEEQLTPQEREAAAETTGPVAASVIEAAEQAVQQRLAGQIGGELEPEPEPEAAPARPHRYLEEEDDTSLLPAAVDEPEPQPQPAPPQQAQPQAQPEPQGEVQLEALAQPIPIHPDQFGKPIPPGSLTPPAPVTPTSAAAAATPPPAPTPQQPKLPEPAPMAAVERPRSLFEPVLDPEDDSYEGPHGFPPLQEPTRTLTSTDSVPFTPILAPELLENEKPAVPIVSTPAGLPKRTASGSWPRGGNGLSGEGPVPFSDGGSPFRPRAPFNPIPRTTDKAPIRRPASGGPRTPFGPGSALPKPDGTAPSAEYVVKAQLASRRYHTASSSGFESAKAEVWFRSAEEAERAGFSSAD